MISENDAAISAFLVRWRATHGETPLPLVSALDLAPAQVTALLKGKIGTVATIRFAMILRPYLDRPLDGLLLRRVYDGIHRDVTHYQVVPAIEAPE